MTAAECAFSAAHYEDVLQRVAAGYEALRFRDWRPAGEGRPRLFLRHDVDHSLAMALAMAEMEAAAGVRATYFVQLHAELYSANSPRAVRALRRIVELGHEVGLHYDGSFYARLGGEPGGALRGDLELLARLAGEPVASVSRHLPTVGAELEAAAELVAFDAYSDRFTRELTYISDSNMSWREGCVCEYLERRVELQVLLHPVWWLSAGADMRERVLDCASVEARSALAEAERVAGFYEECLERRQDLDAKWEARCDQ